MRILFTGESLKGYLYPIIAVHEELKRLAGDPKSKPKSLEVMLISSKSHFLEEMLEGTGIPYKIIQAAEQRNSFSPLFFIDFLKFIIGFFQSVIHIFNYMPDVIFSKGGHVSLSVVMVGWIFRIPIIIHESDAVASPLDKFMFRFAKKVAVSFKNSKEIYVSPKVFFSGNPIISFIAQGDEEKSLKSFALNEEKPTLFIMAGSKGAEEINRLVMEILPELLRDYQIIHQCGIVNYDKVKSIVEKMNVPNLNNYHLFPFFRKRAADAYAVCNLVVSRAGANTVAEIMAVGKPSILIPLASAISDKQKKNAFYYSESGAAILLSEKNLKPHLLLNVIRGIFQSSLKTIEMQRAARKLAQPEAARKIVEEIIKVAK
ncbi:MAG: UDP-N-acetylglucosamine--N-acetylmuramyl-(pentapeptide) pyrophosphoryl-undecaprenol N-acetylglucosamine transferase [Candidatus Pacebacteria bacterium]|nr:UDP-N-acetylglucosamine--N-acetylmuramyl-(pentapeptide) pyrophosphoryl-undecaprenol N-acetylglucosamine transferase [Candidatus Paceibacterota bacterium]